MCGKDPLPSQSSGPLTQEAILSTAERLLRRHGPCKTTVSDVARNLGVSHASIYRYFDNKASLRAAVVRGWLDRPLPALNRIVNDANTVAPQRLSRWLQSLYETRKNQARDDPELFAAFFELAVEEGEAVREHVEDLRNQLRRILVDGQSEGSFEDIEPAVDAAAVLDSTTRFHHPSHARNWSRSTIDADFEGVLRLVIRALARDRA
ncbi:MAG: TetR family transcriptional regulator [Actinophytocola sp.]|nr:TetR family transcriptional regulator [Actinophytocola sp.]